MDLEKLTKHAYDLLKSDAYYMNDAKQGVMTRNTLVGSVMNLTTKAPRWLTEKAVSEALWKIRDEEARSKRKQAEDVEK